MMLSLRSVTSGFALLWLVWAASAPTASAGAEQGGAVGGLTPGYLRCEYRIEPLGVDVKSPRLSWIVGAEMRGQKQTAYQILVAGDEASLGRDQGNLWDSGRIESDETTAVVYAGKAPGSHQACYWKVRVWDKDGRPSAWSKSAHWSMGLLEPSDWSRAEWIGSDKSRQIELPEAPLVGARWIWHAGDKGSNKPKGHRLFVTTLRLPADAKVEKAELIATADDFFMFTINGNLVINGQAGTGGWDHPKSADVTAPLKPGADNTIRVEVNNTSEGPAGLLARLNVTTAGGKTIVLMTDGTWKTTDNPGANWHDRPLDTREWPAAEVLGDYGMAPWGKLKFASLILPPPSYLRTRFKIEKPVRRATLYATALGIFDVSLNGSCIGKDYFNPGWTDYTKRVYYRAFDVTGQVRPGDNAMGAILADGWYSGYVGFGKKRDHYGTKPRFRAILHLEMADGTTTDVVTGPAWKASTGPIRESDFLMGEAYDAREELHGWDMPDYADGAWNPVDLGAELNPVVQWHPGPPVRAISEVKPRSITEPKPGTFVFDMGTNFAGVVRLKPTGDRGTKITLRYAERLNPDGTIYTTNLREARVTDTYICGGDPKETWEPRFTFHGFQYVEVTGLESAPTPMVIDGIVLSSDTPDVAAFQSGDPMLDQLFDNIKRTQRANFIDIPTDCPQRDERLGWTGDAQVYIATAALICDVQAFFTKWLVDLTDGQRADGQFPMVAPVKVAGDDGGPAWADAGVICPWTIYQVYGDRRLLERHYPSMVKFIEFCRKRSTPELLPPKQFHCFGDWLSINADTPKDVIYTAYFAHSTRIVSQAAEVLGKTADAAKYRVLADAIKSAFNRAYVAPDGRIKGNTQACYVLAIAFDLVDGEKLQQAARYLVEDIEKRGGHLSTGFIGTKSLMQALSKVNRQDVAYRLLHNDTFPSWGFSIKQGATSIWERWDGWTPEKGFQDPGMNTFAHYSFGAVYQWMVENIGGIKSDGPAYKHIIIAPVIDERLKTGFVSYDSIRGPVGVIWSWEGGRMASFEVNIPANTTATVHVPVARGRALLESNRPVNAVEGVKVLRTEGDRVVVEVGSGHYLFTPAAK
ncbi:MAG: family 78 glycoside hydrolase catalytic domain [Isosphaeraceae bacterium]